MNVNYIVRQGPIKICVSEYYIYNKTARALVGRVYIIYAFRSDPSIEHK